MNDEIKEILDRLERIDHKEYSGGFEFADSSTFDEGCRCFEERKKLADYITNLQERIDQYENPDDLTLFYMWLDEKAKDKMKQLQEENERLKVQVVLLDDIRIFLNNRIDIAVEIVKKLKQFVYDELVDRNVSGATETHCKINDLLNILNGRSDE